jgi:hypothetical protein
MNGLRGCAGRRRRDRRSPTGQCIGLTERDLLWLEKLHRHGPLASTFLLAYSRSTHRSHGRAKDRLTQLYHEAGKHGGAYLERPWQQFATQGARYHDLVYDVTDAGLRALKATGRLREHTPAPSGPWVHRYMTAAIAASIEIATLRTENIRYIFGDEILGRAGTSLRFSVTAAGVTNNLIPDALFGLGYAAGSRKLYRFFIVEADRGTEPATATASRRRRKSYERTIHQYREFVGKGQYRQALRLTAGMVVLNVTTSDARLQNLIELTGKLSEGGRNSYILFAALPALGRAFRPVDVLDHLLTTPWKRAGLGGFRIDGVE